MSGTGRDRPDHDNRRTGMATSQSLVLVAGIAAVIAAAIVGIAMTRIAGNVALIWLANAVGIGAMLRLSGPRRPLMLAATGLAIFAANLGFGDPWGVSALLAAANVVAVAVTVHGLAALSWDRRNARNTRGLLTFGLVAGIAGPLSGALIGATTLWLAYDVSFPVVARTWFASDMVGILILLPALISNSSLVRIRQRRVEAAGWVLAATGAAALAGSMHVSQFLFLFPPAMILVGMRLGAVGVGACGVPAAVVICWQIASGQSGLFAHLQRSPADMAVDAQLFLLCSIGVGHLIATLWQERREREQRLEQYRVAFDNANDGMLLIDGGGNYLLWNPAFEQVNGYDGEGLKRIGPYGRPEHRESNRILVERMRAGEVISNHRFSRQRPDGSVGEVVLSATPIFEDGAFVGASVVHRDVTEIEQLRQAAERRAAELEYYRTIVDNAADGFLLVAADGTFVLRNPAVDRILGLTDEIIAATGGKGRPRYQAENQALLAECRQGRQVRDRPIERVRQDGVVVDLRLTATPIFADGDFLGASVILRDVTEVERLRREAEERSVELDRFRVAFEHAAEGMALTAPDGSFLVWNPAYERILGIESGILQANPKFGRPQYHAENRALYERNLAGEQVVDHRLQRPRPDGSLSELTLTATPIFDGALFRGSSITLRDVTEVERLRLDAERRAAMLQAFIEINTDVVIGTDAEGRIVMWNSAASRLYGIARDQAMGTGVEDLPGVDRDNVIALRRDRLMRGERIRRPGVARTLPDGSEFVADISVKPIFDMNGTYLGAAGIQRDITEITLARRTEALLASALGAITDGVAIFDAGERLVRCNARYREIYGAAAGKVVPGTLWDDLLRHALEAGIPDMPRAEWDAWLEERRRRRHQGQGAFTLQAAGGRWMLGVDYPIETGGWVAVRQDITDLKRVEEDLQRSNADLEQFAFIASHDLQEPLRKIQSFGQIIAEDHAGDLSGEALQFFGFMIDAADRMQALIDDLLTYSRVANSRETPATVALDDAVAEALDNLSLLVAETGAVVDVDPLPAVTARRSEMVRVFQNIIANAIRYRADDRTPRIGIRLGETSPARFAVHISDNGRGFDPAFADRVFEPFRRLVARDSVAGTGMGLAIVRKAMRQQGGDVTATSSPGIGSVFTLSFRTGNGQENGVPEPLESRQ